MSHMSIANSPASHVPVFVGTKQPATTTLLHNSKMGCCVSTNRSYSSPSSKPCEPPPRSTAKGSENRAPPPEEETVKEVLSETPKWKPKFEAEKPPQTEVENEKEKLFIKPEEISEVSEVCSLSESVSTLADEEARQRVNRSPGKVRKARSFSGELGARRERTAGKSPARRPEQSPGRRNVGSVRVVQMGNGGSGNQPRRRDPGENSGRRSRSPATRNDSVASRSVVGRSPSARRTNQSPARVRSTAAESGCRKMENSYVEGKWPSSANESLENPLVSLECFIFL
ncbi:unnamed protein product [Sphenostylis stenocarpa]|uniref:Uncharacterized protein n=1 Tax=Sphenostylis stenocarpa TaxID=92480 RepID=A0AA86VG15_9FABA|nr:unnamed protein product [Sphenostylis stenocarpa]